MKIPIRLLPIIGLLLGVKSGIYNVESRVCSDGKAYIMECSPRGGGNRLAEMLRYATGVDLISNTVRAAIGEPVVGIEQKPYDGAWAEIILHSEKPGSFQKLEIADEIKANIIEEDLWIDAGTQVGGFSAANEAIGTLVLRFDTQEEMLAQMERLYDLVRVIVE